MNVRVGVCAVLAALATVVAMGVAPSGASAACPETPGVFVTSWIGGSGHYNTNANWTNGVPTGSCDASILTPGSPTVMMTGGSVAKSMTIGGVGSTPTLQISAEGPNTNLNVAAGGTLSIASGAAITLKCNITPSSCGAPNIGAPMIANAGTITVDANVNGTSFIDGALTNTGTMNINHAAKFSNGAVTNQGAVNIADATVLASGGSSCGDGSVSFKNDTGGTLTATGTGTFDVINYEQGAGSTTGTNPVQKPCGTLKYTGNGASKVRAYGGFTLTGTMQGNQSLTISDESSNTIAFLGGPFTNNGTITLTCSIPCGAGGGPDIAGQGNTFTNGGTVTVSADSGTGSVVDSGNGGAILNTGTINFNQSGALAGVINNQGAINIADTKVARNEGSSCGDTGPKVANNTGGSINGTGSGTLSVINYEQGAGTTTGTAPVQIPCGSVKYLGNGAGTVQANGGFTLTGEIQTGQSLVLANSGATAHLGGDVTSKGSILLTCPGGGCGGGPTSGPSVNVNDKDFVNAGTVTVTAASGTGTGVGANFLGTITNTGTMQFDQSGELGGPVTNKGTIGIADGKIVLSNTSSCGDTGGSVKNDTGGQINATGTGTLSAVNYEQGAGTTSGAAPVSVNCGYLKYTGTGASTVTVPSSATMTGNLAAGQTLRIKGGVNNGPFTNAGTIVLDQSTTNPTLNVGTPLTNTGTIELTGPSANTATVGGGNTIEQTGASGQIVVPTGTKLAVGSVVLKAGDLSGGGTITGTVDNQAATVLPGASAGTLSISGNYTQGAAGSLEVELEGTGAGQFDKLAVGGNVDLGGELALQPSAEYAASAAADDSVDFLTYGGTRTDEFASTTFGTELACPNKLGVSYDDTGKKVNVVVSSTGASCTPPDNGGDKPPPAVVPDTTLKGKPKAKVKTGKSKATVKFTFTASVAGATFECKLDKGSYVPCTSPKSYKVKPGKHTFSVRAVSSDATDATPATASFKVVKKKKRKK